MRTFLLCNDQNGHTPVIESYTGKRNKTAYSLIAWIDTPGSYHETLWTAHYDGTDHFFDSKEGCLESIAYFHGADDVDFKQTDIDFTFEMIWKSLRP